MPRTGRPAVTFGRETQQGADGVVSDRRSRRGRPRRAATPRCRSHGRAYALRGRRSPRGCLANGSPTAAMGDGGRPGGARTLVTGTVRISGSLPATTISMPGWTLLCNRGCITMCLTRRLAGLAPASGCCSPIDWRASVVAADHAVAAVEATWRGPAGGRPDRAARRRTYARVLRVRFYAPEAWAWTWCCAGCR